MRATVTLALTTGAGDLSRRAEKQLLDGGFRPKGRRTWEAADHSEERILGALRGLLDFLDGPEGKGRVESLWVAVSNTDRRR